MGCAYMYNYTEGGEPWHSRINLLLDNINIFFRKQVGANPNSIMPPGGGQILAEVTCETSKMPTCNADQTAFKAFLARWMAVTTQLAPFTTPRIMPLLAASANAAAAVCTGQAQGMKKGTVCGRRWYQNVYDSQYGVGEQMSAMSIFQNNLIANQPPPFTAKKGGKSKGDPGAGGNAPGSGTSDGSYSWDPINSKPIGIGDKAGAGVLTAVSVSGMVFGSLWLVHAEGAWFSF